MQRETLGKLLRSCLCVRSSVLLCMYLRACFLVSLSLCVCESESCSHSTGLARSSAAAAVAAAIAFSLSRAASPDRRIGILLPLSLPLLPWTSAGFPRGLRAEAGSERRGEEVSGAREMQAAYRRDTRHDDVGCCSSSGGVGLQAKREREREIE